MIKSLNRETRLLLLCASTRHTEEQKKAIETLAQDVIDWEYLINLANHHRLLPLLYRTLSSVCPDFIPKESLHTLQQFYKINATRCFMMTGNIIQINTICEANSIEILPVKGPLLAETVYGDISLRSFSDIDILVADRDIHNTLKILLKDNYQLLPINIPKKLFLKFLKNNHDGRLQTDKGFLLELHRDLSDSYTPQKMTFAAVTPYIQKNTLLGHRINDMRPELLLVYLALHSSKHGWLPLEQLCCIAELLKKERDFDWTLLFQIASEYKTSRRLVLTLNLVQLLFEIRFPEAVTRKITGKATHELAVKVMNDISNSQVLPKPSERFWSKMQNNRQLMDRRYDFLRMVLKKATTPEYKDWEQLHIPSILFPLYYIFKSTRIIIAGFRHLFFSATHN